MLAALDKVEAHKHPGSDGEELRELNNSCGLTGARTLSLFGVYRELAI